MNYGFYILYFILFYEKIFIRKKKKTEGTTKGKKRDGISQTNKDGSLLSLTLKMGPTKYQKKKKNRKGKRDLINYLMRVNLSN